MNEKHPNRKKDKHNPYTLMIVEGRYYLSFKDGRGVMQNIEIEKVLYDLFNRFELEDISYLNRVSRHIEHSELTENSLNDRVFYKEESLEETVSRCIEYELLHKAISKLPETQRRRLLLYFFGELSYEQIAKLEGCTKMAVKGSVDIALKKLKKLFEKFYCFIFSARFCICRSNFSSLPHLPERFDLCLFRRINALSLPPSPRD